MCEWIQFLFYFDNQPRTLETRQLLVIHKHNQKNSYQFSYEKNCSTFKGKKNIFFEWAENEIENPSNSTIDASTFVGINYSHSLSLHLRINWIFMIIPRELRAMPKSVLLNLFFCFFSLTKCLRRKNLFRFPWGLTHIFV